MTLQSDLLALLPLLERANLSELVPFGGHIDSQDGDTVADCYYNAAHEQDAENVAAAIAAAVNFLRQHHAELAAMARDAQRYRWLHDNVQPWINGNDKPHAVVNVCVGELPDGKIGWHTIIGSESRVGVVTLGMAVDAAMTHTQENGK